MKTVAFVLPSPSSRVNGGYKVVYEYANRLSKQYNVNIFYVVKNPKHTFHRMAYMPIIVRYMYMLVMFKCLKHDWYLLDDKITEKVLYELTDNDVLGIDVLIATYWSTAFSVDRVNCSKKLYLIQHYEDWAGNKDFVKQSYMIEGIKNIVISNWIKDKIYSVGGTVNCIIPNGLDFHELKVVKSPLVRNKSILMMYHPSEWKGSSEGINVLKRIYDKYGNRVNITMFGAYKKPDGLPQYINYIYKPSRDKLVDLYNNHGIFFCTSWYEGFGLPAAEAMACGCAIVTTDNGGCHEYAKDGVNSIIVKPHDCDGLYRALECLIDDEQRRVKLAINGIKSIKTLSWDEAVRKLSKCIEE